MDLDTASSRKPNVVFVFPDQLRRCATGFGGDLNIATPSMDRLAGESLDFQNAISGMPVCCPARATLMTGLYAHHHGVLVNDVHLDDGLPKLAEQFVDAGYDTAYIGKWHLNGRGRKAYITPENRCGFQYWKALECTHDYNESAYYAGDDDTQLTWDGYDAFAQTDDAINYLNSRSKKDRPFMMMLSWGPPHDPYETAPQEFRDKVETAALKLRPNVPPEQEEVAREELAGYYAHILALDHALDRLDQTLEEAGLAEDTIFVFWSDHGDMLHSQGHNRKQRPWEESIRVPLLIRYPKLFGRDGRKVPGLINTPDLMPTLLGLCDIPVPESVDGTDYTDYLKGREEAPAEGVLLTYFRPFGEYLREGGGREYRGVRTEHYTYTARLDGPWLLYDNEKDPYQQVNLVSDPESKGIIEKLDRQMRDLMRKVGDEFHPGDYYAVRLKGYLDESGHVPVRDYI
jgi:arylsulfatase A-like enzyme